jgi:uncharacterized protein
MAELPEIIQRIDTDFKTAMKSGDKVRLGTLRLLRAALKEKEIALRGEGRPLTDDDVLATLSTAAKKRKESIEEYTKGGRTDRAAEEKAELDIIQAYLPEQLSPEAIADAVRKSIEETGATSIKDMGKVMSAVMPALKGRADGREVQTIVKQLLGG